MQDGGVRALSVSEAYDAMFKFLENYYFETGPAEVGTILAELQLIGPQSAADSRSWPAWMKAVADVIAAADTE